jgi:hypothetical protein
MPSAIATLLFTFASITSAPDTQSVPAQPPAGSPAAVSANEGLWAAARGAYLNQQNTFYQIRPIDMAMANNHPDGIGEK